MTTGLNNQKEIKIRNLAIDDVEKVADIKVKAWRDTYGGILDDEYLDLLGTKLLSHEFIKFVDSDKFIVATINDKVVGFCSLLYDNSLSPNIHYADCELTAIYVHPDFKHQGIGATLFKDALKRFKDKNRTNMVVWCLADNDNAIKFYKHMGGEIKEERMIKLGDKSYKEIGIIYDIERI